MSTPPVPIYCLVCGWSGVAGPIAECGACGSGQVRPRRGRPPRSESGSGVNVTIRLSPAELSRVGRLRDAWGASGPSGVLREALRRATLR